MGIARRAAFPDRLLSLRPMHLRSLPVCSWPDGAFALSAETTRRQGPRLLTGHLLKGFLVLSGLAIMDEAVVTGFCVDMFSGYECQGEGGRTFCGEHVQFCRKLPNCHQSGRPISIRPAVNERAPAGRRPRQPWGHQRSDLRRVTVLHSCF